MLSPTIEEASSQGIMRTKTGDQNPYIYLVKENFIL